ADAHGIPFTLSTVSVCPIEEVAPAIKRPMLFQLYVLRDRGFMRNALAQAKSAGCSTQAVTVVMPTPGAPLDVCAVGRGLRTWPLNVSILAVPEPGKGGGGGGGGG
ncbi:alpha-hydroxy-acid oxidizing protein, partial [Escherichia coli]|uniref:alpha-hydroxy-acid oxidizing protein n=1 Tax=Escherichia coli TaxID=562 RepID=UPI001484EE06